MSCSCLPWHVHTNLSDVYSCCCRSPCTSKILETRIPFDTKLIPENYFSNFVLKQFCAFKSSKTKTLQMATLQVKIRFFLCWEISAQGVSKNMVGNCVLIFFCGFLPALNFHLQCYRLRCFSFAHFKSSGKSIDNGNRALVLGL